MQRIRAAGFGLAAALSIQPAVGQDAGRPAARLGVVRPAAQLGAVTAADPSVQPAGMVARGQTANVVRASGTGSVSLTMPQPATGPSVTETRSAPLAAPSPTGVWGAGPPQVVGVGQPFLVGQPPAGQPMPVGQPIPGGPPVPVSADPFCPPGPAVGGPVGVPPLFPTAGPAVAPAGPGYGGYLQGPTGLLTGGGRFTFNADYLMWYVKSGTQPTLLTTSAPADRGILGAPTTTSVLGGPSFQDNLHGGARFGATYWFGPRQVWGVSGDVFFLGRNGETYEANSHQFPVLARPFYSQNLNRNVSELVGFPGIQNGAASVNTETSIFGGGVDFRRRLIGGPCGGCNNLDLLVGFRGLRVAEELNIGESIAYTPAGTAATGLVSQSVTDQFRTENEFYGLNMGLAGEVRRGRWFLNGKATVAIGDVFETVQINGSQQVFTTAGPAAAAGGLYALPGANIGTFSRNRFAVLPEVGLQLGYYLTPHWRFGVGYNFLYLSNLVRPADQIDMALDQNRIPFFNVPGQPVPPVQAVRPTPTFRETDLFIQGISFSLQFIW